MEIHLIRFSSFSFLWELSKDLLYINIETRLVTLLNMTVACL